MAAYIKCPIAHRMSQEVLIIAVVIVLNSYITYTNFTFYKIIMASHRKGPIAHRRCQEVLEGAVGTVVVVVPGVRLGLSQHGINIKPLGPSVSYVCLYVREQLNCYALSNCLDVYVIM